MSRDSVYHSSVCSVTVPRPRLYTRPEPTISLHPRLPVLHRDSSTNCPRHDLSIRPVPTVTPRRGPLRVGLLVGRKDVPVSTPTPLCHPLSSPTPHPRDSHSLLDLNSQTPVDRFLILDIGYNCPSGTSETRLTSTSFYWPYVHTTSTLRRDNPEISTTQGSTTSALTRYRSSSFGRIPQVGDTSRLSLPPRLRSD